MSNVKHTSLQYKTVCVDLRKWTQESNISVQKWESLNRIVVEEVVVIGVQSRLEVRKIIKGDVNYEKVLNSLYSFEG